MGKSIENLWEIYGTNVWKNINGKMLHFMLGGIYQESALDVPIFSNQ